MRGQWGPTSSLRASAFWGTLRKETVGSVWSSRRIRAARHSRRFCTAVRLTIAVSVGQLVSSLSISVALVLSP
eukprot:5425100-Lingulodinium_polyedra.AAC.1